MNTPVELSVGLSGDGGYGAGELNAVLRPDILAQTALGGMTLSPDLNPKEWLKISDAVHRCIPDSPEVRAQVIIDQITTRARLAGQVGQNYALLMSIGKCDYRSPGSGQLYGIMEGEWLTGAAKIVWQHCVNASQAERYRDFQPTLEYWESWLNPDDIPPGSHDSGSGGFNLVIHFPPSSKAAAVPHEKLAETVIAQIPVRALLEALCGRVHAVVMSVPANEVNREHPAFTPAKGFAGEVLQGASREVFNYCKANGLHPTIEYWSSNEGGAFGYNIVIHWLVNAAGDGR